MASSPILDLCDLRQLHDWLGSVLEHELWEAIRLEVEAEKAAAK